MSYKRKFGTFGGSSIRNRSRYSEKTFFEDHPYVKKPSKKREKDMGFTWNDLMQSREKSWKHQTKNKTQWGKRIKTQEQKIKTHKDRRYTEV